MNSYKEIVEWDVVTWSRAFEFWSKIGTKLEIQDKKGLELGARNGGTSLFFVKKFNIELYCSDYGFPTQQAYDLHDKNDIQEYIQYFDVDATKIPFEDNMFDVVVFKSILGTIGSYGDYSRIEKAISEMYRVLKPGGVLLFAENLKASKIHDFARNKFVEWGPRWYYVKLEELWALFFPFKEVQIITTGFLAAFVPNNWKLFKSFFSHLDSLLFWIPDNMKYVSYGYAIK